MDQVNKPQPVEASEKPGLGSKIKEKIKQYKRVLSVAHKPDKEEFITSAKITSGGIVFLGLVGFVIFLIYYMILMIPGV